MNNSSQDCAVYADEISDSDIIEAMREIEGYIDITPEDFREVYRHAYRHVLTKVIPGAETAPPQTAADIIPSVENGIKPAPPGLFQPARKYISKMFSRDQSPPRVSLTEIAWSWTGAFLGIGAVAYCNYSFIAGTDFILLIGSFGASAVLIYGAIKSPLAQPRNLIGGHVISAIIGVACFRYFSFNPWLASALAVSCSIAVMHYLRILHPPGGATALIAVTGSDQIHSLGYLYAVMPVGAGALMMLAVALLVNNLSRGRKYPEYWI